MKIKSVAFALGLVFSAVLFVAPANAVTIPPTLVSPSSSATVAAGNIPIQYVLPEAPAPGSVVLSITGGPNSVVCQITLTDVLTNSFSLDISDLNPGSAGGNIVSTFACSGVVLGSGYSITILYQNVVLDPIALATASNIDIVASISSSTSAPTTSILAPPIPQGTSSSLPETGSNTILLVVIAASFLLGGFLFVRATRSSKS
jgi:LPXTG-motif cell wall-anchored protein